MPKIQYGGILKTEVSTFNTDILWHYNIAQNEQCQIKLEKANILDNVIAEICKLWGLYGRAYIL